MILATGVPTNALGPMPVTGRLLIVPGMITLRPNPRYDRMKLWMKSATLHWKSPETLWADDDEAVRRTKAQRSEYILFIGARTDV